MNISEETIRRLQELAGVAEEQARAALEAAKGELLDALLWLQENGIIPDAGVGRYSTASGCGEREQAGSMTQSRQTRQQEEETSERMPRDFPGMVRWVWHFLVNNRLEVYKKYDPARVIQCPIGALIALVAIAWFVVAVCLIVGIFMGWRYRLAGPQLGSRRINDVVSRLDDSLERIRDEIDRLIHSWQTH